MLLQIFTGAPLWVWPLFVLLCVIGIRATKPRCTSIKSFLILPLLGILSAAYFAALPHPALAWSSFLGFGGLGGLVFFSWQRGQIGGIYGPKVELAGEWATFAMIMLSFWSNFGYGVFSAVAPSAATTSLAIALYASFIGFAGGSFSGRAIQILVQARKTNQTPPPLQQTR
ncbi:hypothetical protein PUV47_09580 [Pseudovibrio exalbescens]|uniref:hypothetical protein n=1 Tax=Pseudovibrio exalbescens TaxID=197461 RepID=UPI002365AD14|nr:hypothetical protein [Pseudovibrio exalbescens]MDD7910168.1 hypothetical protein [Pseudovibrio exalbescens]